MREEVDEHSWWMYLLLLSTLMVRLRQTDGLETQSRLDKQTRHTKQTGVHGLEETHCGSGSRRVSRRACVHRVDLV